MRSKICPLTKPGGQKFLEVILWLSPPFSSKNLLVLEMGLWQVFLRHLVHR